MNRIDDTIIFNKLSKNIVKDIAIQKIRKIKEKYNDVNINVSVSNKVIEEIIQDSNYEEYGARKLDKIINTKLDNLIIDELLLGKEKLNIQTIH